MINARLGRVGLQFGRLEFVGEKKTALPLAATAEQAPLLTRPARGALSTVSGPCEGDGVRGLVTDRRPAGPSGPYAFSVILPEDALDRVSMIPEAFDPSLFVRSETTIS